MGAIRHAAAGAGCWFWLDPVLVHSGCCGRGSASVIVFFHTISTHFRLLLSGMYFFSIANPIFVVRALRTIFPTLLPRWRHVCGALPCVCVYLPVLEFLFFVFFLIFFLLFIFTFCVSVEHSSCAVDTLCRPVLSVRGCLVFGSIPILEHIMSVCLLRQWAIFVGTLPHPPVHAACPYSVPGLVFRRPCPYELCIHLCHPFAYWLSTNIITSDCYSFLRRPILINTSLSVRHRRLN